MAQTNYTYDQFVTDARNAGLYDQFSTADLNLAKRNPDAGMQILNFKVDYGKATTDEQRALASQNAEDVRKRYGYSGGTDGSGFQTLGGDTQSSIYSYDDVQKKAQESGVFMSAEDLALAQKNPDVGMSLINNKIGYANATTPEAQSSFNQKNETLRRSYGGYTAGTDGGGFSVALPSPNDYVAPEAPKYANNRQGEVDDLWNKQKNYEDFSYDVKKPTYESQYDDEMQSLLTDILNREAFSYDAESDPLYSQYKKQYLREGERASADALGAAAAATGGIPSSYAATAAAQAGNYYAAQLTDKIPELYQLAYNQYMNEHQMKLNNLEAVGAMDDRYYGRYLDEVDQWNRDRNFEYGVYGDKYNRLADLVDTARDMEETDYSRYLDDVTQYNKDREFGYKQLTDEIDHQTSEREAALKEAIRQQEYKDERGDKAFEHGYDLALLKQDEDAAEFDKEYKTKLLEGEAAALDADRENTILNALLDIANTKAKGGDYSLLNSIQEMLREGNVNLAEMIPAPESDTASTASPTKAQTQAGGAVSLAQLYPDGVIRNLKEWYYIQDILGGYDKMVEAGLTFGGF